MFSFFRKSRKDQDAASISSRRSSSKGGDRSPTPGKRKNNQGDCVTPPSPGTRDCAPAVSCVEATQIHDSTKTNTTPTMFGGASAGGGGVNETTTKRAHNVKPCGHGTVAVSPRIPPTTPPASPVLAKLRNNSDGALSVKPTRPRRGERKGSLQDKPMCNGIEEDDKKNLVNQEAKFQGQLNDLSKQLTHRDAEANKLRFQMEELQRDVFAKSAGMDRLQAELQAAHKESEYVKQRIKNLEHDLEEHRHKNSTLSEELSTKTENYAKTEVEAEQKISQLEDIIKELKEKIGSLETQIEELQKEKRQLELRHETIMAEREEEKKIVEEKLEVAIKEKDAVNQKWEQEFEKMRTVSMMKEQQMLDDFEWKLREVEKSCKKKLMEKDRSIEERLREACNDAEEKMRIAQEMMNEVEYLKEYETEMEDLKEKNKGNQITIEQMQTQQEQLKTAEQSLREETKKLRSLIDLEKENMQHMQRMHHQEILDKERWLHHTLQEKKTEIAVYWEEKLLHEISRLKEELEQLYLEERQVAMEKVRRQKEDEFAAAKKTWEKKIDECLKEISSLKHSLDEKEKYYHSELIAQQTTTDRDIFELRRIMDKIDNAHHERFEQLVNDHEKEIDKMTDENARKLQELEASYKAELIALRSNLESVREQMERESQQKIQTLIQQHRSELDTQWANLVHQKSEAIKLVEQEYVNKYQTLEEQFYTQQRSHEAREIELLKTIDSLKNDLDSKKSTVYDLQSSVDTLEGGVQVLRQEIAQQGDELMKNRRDADQKIRGLQDILIKLQALQEQEREEFQTKLAQQQKQSQTTVDHLQRKCTTLTKLFEEVRSRYERRESRQEDLNTISDLKQVISEQEKDLACINEEKRYYQMQLLKQQRNFDDEEEEFVDSEEYIENGKTNGTNGSYHGGTTRALPVTAAVSIPPTIPECDDCDDD